MLIDVMDPYAWAIALATVGLAGFLGLPFWWLFQDGRRYRRLRRERAARVLPAVDLHAEVEAECEKWLSGGPVG